MILRQGNGQDSTLGIGNGRRQGKDRFPGLIAQARAGVNPPRGFILAVNREFHRTGHPLLAGFVIKDGFERHHRLFEIRGGFCELQLGDFRGSVGRSSLHFKLRQSGSAFERAAWAAQRESLVREQLQAKRRDVLQDPSSPIIFTRLLGGA